MTTQASTLISGTRTLEKSTGITLCHFSTAHTQLKSRSFHRECLPLAAHGIGIRYVSPANVNGRRDRVDFVPLPESGNRARYLLPPPSLVRLLLKQQASLYHFQDPELISLALALKLIFRKRVVYDAYEDFPSMALNKDALPRIFRPIAAKLVAAAERLAARCFDGVMTADPITLRRLARTGASRKLVFFNFPNLDFFPPPGSEPKEFDVVYRGGLSERSGTWVLLDALRLLADRATPATLLLIGYFDNAAAESALRNRIHSLKLESRVEVCGRMDHAEMSRALSRARIGVCPLQDIPKFRSNIPVKVFEYWACGLPVVASDLPPIRPFFRSAAAGLLFQASDASALARSIAWLLDHPHAAARMGREGRTAVLQRFNNRNEIHKLWKFCMQIAAKP
jgi:glycosyltransferase involved in cell wall biosynthesis